MSTAVTPSASPRRWRGAARPALVVVLAAVPALVVLVTRLVWSAELPALLPTHWSGLGRPDGYTARGTVLTVAQAVTAGAAVVAAGAVLALLATTTRAARSRVRATAVLACVVGGVGATTAVTVVWATLAAGGNQDATLGARVLLVLLGLAWGLLPLLLLPRGDGRAHHDDPPSTMDLGDGERAAWHTSVHSAPLLGALGAALVLLVVVAVVAAPVAGVLVVVPLAVLVVLGRVRVSVDRRGLRVRGGLGVPLRTVPPARVARADAAEVRAVEWGGWGYRVGPGRAALVLRSGPGLVVELTDGTRFAVTLDDAATPAALLNTLAAGAARSGA
ncbi:hypothetical protein GCM10027047_13760 [Rhodococcus aerolatus]